LGLIIFAIVMLPFALPYLIGGDLEHGMKQTFGRSYKIINVVFAWVILLLFNEKRRPLSDKLLLWTICATSLVFLYIKGVEVPAGLWSHRRLTPVIICMISLLATVKFRTVKWALCRRYNTRHVLETMAVFFVIMNAFLFITDIWSPFTVSDGKGGEKIRAGLERSISAVGDDALVVFDYFQHSFPHQRRGRNVFGINEHVVKRGEHGPVLEWMKEEAENGRVVLYVSSYDEPKIPEGVDLDLTEVGANGGTYKILRGKNFKDTAEAEREVGQKIYIVNL